MIKFDSSPQLNTIHIHKNTHTSVHKSTERGHQKRYFRPPAVEHLLFFAHFGSSNEIKRLKVQLSQLLCSKMRKTFFYYNGLWHNFNLTHTKKASTQPFTQWRAVIQRVSQVLLREDYAGRDMFCVFYLILYSYCFSLCFLSIEK